MNQFIRIHCIDETKTDKPTIALWFNLAHIIAIEPIASRQYSTQILTTNDKILKVIENEVEIMAKINGE